MDAALPSYNFA